MFTKALRTAEAFTYPLVLSRLNWRGDCSSSMGTCVVVNADGWLATAGHIVHDLQRLESEVLVSRKYEADLLAAEAIPDQKAQLAAKKALKKPAPSHTRRFSVWCGGLPGNVGVAVALSPDAVDFGLLRLDGFDPTVVNTYPTFKKPDSGVLPGAALCKVGFPFHAFTPKFENEVFKFPDGTSFARFPIEGMFTRLVQFPPEAGGVVNYPLMHIETSTPGLKGQSGGPTIDIHGTVWAVQCRTAHLSLGFDPAVPNGNGAKEHQFLNVGRGVHPVTMFGLFDQYAVKYQVSDY